MGAIRNPPELVSFDVETALEVAREHAGDGILSCVEFTPSAFHTVYLSETVFSFYRDRDHVREHFERIRSHSDVDLNERDLLEEQFSEGGSLQYFVTEMANASMLRFYRGDEGLWLTTAPQVSAVDIAETVNEAISDGGDAA